MVGNRSEKEAAEAALGAECRRSGVTKRGDALFQLGKTAGMGMDDIDRKLLNLIQEDFPITAAPFAEVAAQLGIGESDVLKRIARLKEEGVIRRIGAVFDLRKLGFASTLCAARVPEGEVRGFVEAVNACSGVTHNYRRDDEYNIWFTLIATGEEELAAAFAGIQRETGIDDILSLRATRTFKINARFDV
jgi:DNA-binding Lrp family transcriptional regulator